LEAAVEVRMKLSAFLHNILRDTPALQENTEQISSQYFLDGGFSWLWKLRKTKVFKSVYLKDFTCFLLGGGSHGG
jgi:hypothetical protein